MSTESTYQSSPTLYAALSCITKLYGVAGKAAARALRTPSFKPTGIFMAKSVMQKRLPHVLCLSWLSS